ncbi:MAG TPA: Na+/H+ antiporter NhaA [Chthoniobacterales bacterium]|nr:Na+/H+ antiporter NhaA [Chthoniobacterales bacterium]
MTSGRLTKLTPPVDPARDHSLGEASAEMTLVEYGSYACASCHAVHELVADLRDRFGERMRYVFRHRPRRNNETAWRAAELAEYAAETTGDFWQVHDALIKRGPALGADDLEGIAAEFDLPRPNQQADGATEAAHAKVKADVSSAKRSGVLATPTFFVNGRRYHGPWDENSLAEAMLGTLGHRFHTAALDFVRWGASAGFLLLFMSILAVVGANAPIGPAFEAFWQAPFGLHLGGGEFVLSLLDWVNHGLLSIFFLVVGLEIKREFTVGHLATFRSGALPVAGAIGGMILPIGIYLLIAPSGPLSLGWGVPIATDTAFAVALIVLLGERVAVELRVFLTAAVIIDDLAAIAIIAIFYTESISLNYLILAGGLTILLVVLNRGGIYSPLPYAIAGVLLWFFLHESGVHATLAGVILALVTPTLPPANMRALMAQADAILEVEARLAKQHVLRHGLSEPALRALDSIHRRIESPTDKLLRSMEPWSSYAVLPIFALANAGVFLSLGVFKTHSTLMLAIILGLIAGKPLGIFLGSWLAVRFRIAVKPREYSWRQLLGAGAFGGIGFTMSLFIAREAFPNAPDFAASKIAIFIASILAGVIGTAILWPKMKKPPAEQEGNV